MPSLSILSTPTVPLAERQTQCAKQIATQVQSTFTTVINAQRNSFNQIWRNSQLTPQEALDSLGAKASELFILGAATVEFIEKISPGKLSPNDYLPLKEVVFNPDGTVTVTENSDANRVALGLST